MKIYILITLFFAADLFVWWGGRRFLRKNNARRGFLRTFHFFMAFQVLVLAALVFARVRNISIDVFIPTPLVIVTFIWHLILAPVALMLNLLELTRQGVSTLWRSRRTQKQTPSPAEPAPSFEGNPVSRREFLNAAVALAPPLLTLSVSTIAIRQLQTFRVRRITAVLPQLPRDLDGMTIAHISDTHVGRFSHGEVLRKIADTTNNLKADLVVFTGDLINDSLRWLPEAIEMLQRIDSRVILCEGNHDLIADPFEFRARIKSTPDMTLLVNETRSLTLRGVPIQILGLCWGGPHNNERKRWGSEFTLEKSTEQLLRMRAPEAFPIMLAHHPHAWDHAVDIPLTLSGHTHGGQLMLNESLGVGPMMFRYWTGLYTRPASDPRSAGALVVSNGVGNWFPLRVSAPAEIVHITLRRPA